MTAVAERDDLKAAAHIGQALGAYPAEPYVGIVLYNGNTHVGSVLVNGWANGNCFFTAVVTGPLSVKQVRYVFNYCFKTLDCNRITATTDTSNFQAIHAMQRLGFQYEGLLRGFYNGKDAAVYGLLRDEQRIVRNG